MVWSDKHNFFICGCDGGRVRGFSPAEQMFTEMFSISEFGQGRITSIAISKQGKFLVIGTD